MVTPFGATISAPFGGCANALMTRSMSAASRTLARVNCAPNDGAAASIPCQYAICERLSGSRMTATRLLPGAVSLSNSSHLPPIGCSKLAKPVTLPPGRARLATKPSLTGSDTCTNTIGTECVSRLSATSDGVAAVKITSGVITHQFGRVDAKAILIGAGQTIFDANIPTFLPPQPLQLLVKRP